MTAADSIRGRVLIGCERSGVMREAFRARGFDAVSCDLVRADDGSNHHVVGDVLELLDEQWHLAVILHPPCTRLCNSGVRWLYIGGKRANGPDPAQWRALEAAAAFYRACRERGPTQRRALENPVMHQHAIAMTGRSRAQFVQPWWFGEPYFKATGFELVKLPPLVATQRLVPPKAGTPAHKAWSMVHRASPGPDRARLRSETFPGLAQACAEQWGAALLADRTHAAVAR